MGSSPGLAPAREACRLATTLLAHGLGEHSGRYHPLSGFLTRIGYLPDRFTMPTAYRRTRCGRTPDATTRVEEFGEAYHELFDEAEPTRAFVLDALRGWLEALK